MPMPTDKKAGAFRDWTEDEQQVDLQLPLPPDTQKKDIAVVITKTSLVVRHVRTQQMLLHAEPLSGPLVVEDSMWYLQGELLVIVLSKQWRGATNADQYWGAHFVKTYDENGMRLKDAGTFECYMTRAQLAAAKEARESQQAEEEKERLARVQASREELAQQQQQQEQEQHAATELLSSGSARRRVPVRELDKELDESDESDDAPPRPPKPQQSLLAQHWGTFCLAALLLLCLELGLSWRSYWQLAQNTLGLSTNREGAADDDGEAWVD